MNIKFTQLAQNKKFQAMILVVVPFLLYVRIVNFEYIGFDDTRLIVENQKFLTDVSNIPQAFRQDFFETPNRRSSNAYYRPLVTLSYMLDAHLGKVNPSVYHFTNIILHILSCLLILQFFRMLNMKPETAFVLAIAFSVHPLLSQAIAWIPGRNDVILALFILSGMICLMKFLKDSSVPYFILHYFFFMAALFTKETSILFPLFSLYLSIYLFGRKVLSRNHLVLITGYLAIIVVWAVLRELALSEQKEGLISWTVHLRNFLYNFPLLLQYITKIFIPYKLSPLSTVKDTIYFLGITVTVFICLGIFLSKERNWNKILFGTLWFLLFLMPSFVTARSGMEHRVYLPLIGLLIVGSELKFMRVLSFNKRSSVVIITLVFILVAVNIKHTGSYRNLLTFWQVAAEHTNHSALVFLNYGAALFKEGKDDAAIQAYKRGIEVDLKLPWIHNNLALVYMRKKMYLEAEAEFFKELKYHPDYSDVYYNLGLLYKNIGFVKKADQMWKRAVFFNPNHQQALDELAGRNTLPGQMRYLSDPK